MLLSSRMKAEPLNTTNAEHYIWGEACDGWHLVRSQELSIIEERMPPNTAERRHFHSKADQFFYILSGEAQMEIEGQIIILSTRNGIFIAHGQRHEISNKCDQDVTFLVISRWEWRCLQQAFPSPLFLQALRDLLPHYRDLLPSCDPAPAE